MRQGILSRSGWWQVPLLLLVSLYPVLPNWFDRHLPATHEGYRYLLLSDWFSGALASGVYYPRWLPEMNGGFGYPEFVFYQPAYFFLNAVIALVAEPLFLRQLLTLSLIALLGGLGAYLLARRFTSVTPAVLLVALFQLAPYVHANLLLRGDLSEWMAVELMPWPVYFLLRLCCEGSEDSVGRRMANWLGLALSMAVLCYCHPVALMFVPLLVVCLGSSCLLAGRQLRPFMAWGELLSAIVFGLLLSSPYWLTVMQMKRYVNIAAVLDGFVAAKNTVGLPTLLWGSWQQEPLKEFFGAPFVVAALVGFWRGRRHTFIFNAGCVYLAMLLLITPAGQWFWRIYPFSLLQFPWRLAAFAPLLQIICLCGLMGGDGRNRIGKGWLVAGFALLLLWSWHGPFGFMPAETANSPLHFDRQALGCLRNFAQTGSPGRYVTTLDAGEWLPRSAVALSESPARGTLLAGCGSTQQAMAGLAVQMGLPGLYDLHPVPRPLVDADRPEWLVSAQPSSTAFRLDYRLSGAAAAHVTINQIYLPGWRVLLNDLPISREKLEGQLLPDGRMRLALPPGDYHLQAWYDGPPGWRVRSALIALFCCIALMYWAYRWSTERKSM